MNDTWIRLDDGFPEHPKVLGIPDAAKWLYIVGLCYASRQLTDGYIPDAALTAGQRRTAAHLEQARLWARDSDQHGWLIHNYLERQRSRATVEELRKKRSESGSKGARARWQKP